MYSIKIGSFSVALELHKDGTFIKAGKREWWWSRLAGIEGKFVMSINNVPEIRELFKDFLIQKVATKYSVNKSENKGVTELLILNYTPPKK